MAGTFRPALARNQRGPAVVMTVRVPQDQEPATNPAPAARPARRRPGTWPAGAVMTFAGLFFGSYLADPFAVAFRVVFVIGLILLNSCDSRGRS